MEADRPIVVDREGRQMIWDPSSHQWVDASQDEQDRERYNGMPESMSGENPATDTEYPDNPRSFGTFGSEQTSPTYWNDPAGLDYDSNEGQPSVCEQCHKPLDPHVHKCPHCMWPVSYPGDLPTKQQAGGGWSGGGFPQRDPNLNYQNQGDNGFLAKTANEPAFDFSAPAPLPGAAPGADSDKAETHRFVIDRNGGVFLEPVPFEHHEIVNKYGLDEAARGSIYRNGTADVHRAWTPIDAPGLERTLGQHMGQHSVPLNYYPGKAEGMTEGMTAHGVPIGPMQGYIWKQEHGVPSAQLAQTVPLVFAAEHATPDDLPAYKDAKGFLTATGGGASHAVVEGRQRNMGGAVGIGPDYNKVVHGAPVSVRDDGTVELGHSDPDSIVHEYFQRTPEDWALAQEERQRKLQKYPEWVRTRGGSVQDKSQDELAIEAMTFGPKVAANLDACPECGDVMVERPEGKVCANCGHTQKIIQMEAGIDWTGNPLDSAEQIGGFAKDHPLETAGLVGLGALAIPTGGADLALAPEIEGGLAAADAGLAGADAAGVGAEAAGLGAGEAGAAAQTPGRVRTLLNGAKSTGKGAIMYNGIQGAINGASGMLGGGQGGTGQVNNYQGLVASVDDDPRFAFWQYSFDDDPDTMTLGGGSDDGEGSTDRSTRDSQEETGESLDELLKGLTDDGSANRGAYSDDQKAALDHFNKNLPIIVELATSDEDHSDHPVVQELEQMLAQAFGDHDHGHDQAHGEEDQHHEEHVDEAHEADKAHTEAKVSHNGCTGEGCKFCENKGKLPGMGGADNDDDEDATPSIGEMQAEDERAMEDHESKTAWSVMDMSESEVEAIFAGSPTIEFESYPEITSATLVSTMPVGPSGKGPKETEIEEEEAKARDKDDEKESKVAMPMPGNQPMPSGGDPQMAQSEPQQPEQQGNFQDPESFIQYLQSTLIPDLHESGSDAMAEDFEEAIKFIQQGQGQAPQANMPEAQPPEPKAEDPGDSAIQPMMSKTADQHPAVTPERVVPGPDSAIDKGHPWADVTGQGLQEGQKYLMKSDNYSVPDEVTIQKVKPTSIVVTINTGGIEFPNEISHEDLQNDGLKFEPVAMAQPEQVQQAEQGAQPDSTPDANEQTDMSTPTTQMPTAAAEEPVETPEISQPVDGLIYTNDKGEPVNYMEYAASLRAKAPPHLAWLWDNIEDDIKASDRTSEMLQMTAGKNFTTQEQREFINESGEARNKDKLDLDGTHYLMDDDDDADLWMA